MFEHPVKLVIAGNMGAGKTTAICAISDEPPVATDVPIFGETMGDKTTTTAAFDFGTVSLDDGSVLHVYGMPGQEHFDFMRPIVAAGAMGAIVLLDATSPQMADDCCRWLRCLKDIGPDLRFVVAVTKSDIAPDFSLRRIRQTLQDMQVRAPILTCDARVAEQCRQMLRTLLAELLARDARAG
ncbi:GTP-binding protein [Ahniella affigens]|nr:ATP/GTP-binding protein [Ahniella affigens]